MAADDFRIRIELPEEGPVDRLLERLHLDLRSEARHVAEELEGHRLAVSREGNEIFVYAGSRQLAEQAQSVVESELREEGVEATTSRIEQWLPDEDRWTNEPEHPTVEEEVLAEGYSPWEVRVDCRTRDEARRLEDRLEREGYSVSRRWQYVFAGAATEEEARELAERLHGEVEPSEHLVWETLPQNPFSVFGGLGGTGTPL